MSTILESPQRGQLLLGLGIDGKLVNRTYGSIDADADNERVYETGRTLGELSKHPVNYVCRIQRTMLFRNSGG
jgi:hypothetical protein